MSKKKQQLISEIKVEQKQKLGIAADALCRKAISEFCGVSAADIIFEYNQYGKPYAKGLNVHFNVSHSGDIAVCAVSHSETGIDIEKLRDINPRTAKKFASDEEQIYIDNNRNGFFEIWTLKEAFFKCKGTGLRGNIKEVSFKISRDSIECSEKGYSLSFCNIDENYICSICEKTALD